MGSSVYNKVKRDLLPLVEAAHPSAFDRTDVHEDVLAAVIWLYESEALLAIEPLHSSRRHFRLPFKGSAHRGGCAPRLISKEGARMGANAVP